MAVIKPQLVSDAWISGRAKVFQWVMAAGDTAIPLIFPAHADKTVTVEGTFGGDSIALQGTANPSAGASLDTLLDPFQALLTFTARGTRVVHENVYQIAPLRTGVAGGTITISLLVQGDH